MFGNTVAFAGAEKELPGLAEDPGLLGTDVDIAVDLPPHPQTKKMMVDEKKSRMIFATYQTPGRCKYKYCWGTTQAQ